MKKIFFLISLEFSFDNIIISFINNKNPLYQFNSTIGAIALAVGGYKKVLKDYERYEVTLLSSLMLNFFIRKFLT